MEKNSAGVYVVVVVFALLVLAGFYFIFDRMSSQRGEVADLNLRLKLLEMGGAPGPAAPPTGGSAPTPPPAATTTPPAGAPANAEISTAVIFDASSSPLLQPQTKLAVQIEKAVRSQDGTLTLSVKVFTGEATSYSSFDPRDAFTLINLDGENTKASLITGQFASMPPKSAVGGTVIFKTDPARATVILQVGAATETAKFYEFDFGRGVYRETVIG